MKKFLSLFCFVVCSSFVVDSAISAEKNVAKNLEWKIDQKQSSIGFEVQQDSSKITGSFKNFSGEIFFDQAHLKESRVKIEIDLNSLSMSFAEAVDTAKNKDWFDVKMFPKALFQSKKITKISENKFRVEGALKLKGKELPLNFDFNFKEYSANKAQAVGDLKLSRSSFGVGDADEKKANGVKDSVAVKFVISAAK